MVPNIELIKKLAKQIPTERYITISIGSEQKNQTAEGKSYWVIASYEGAPFYFNLFDDERRINLVKNNEKLICYFELGENGFINCKDILFYTENREQNLSKAQSKRAAVSNTDILNAIKEVLNAVKSIKKYGE